MTDPAKLMTEAKALLERAEERMALYDEDSDLSENEVLIYDLAKVLAAMLAQEEARFGKDTQV